jgi:hypothetical protein
LLQVVIFKIPCPGWTTAKIGSYALTEAFEKAANMPVVDVTVTGGGKVAKIKFYSETAAMMTIFHVVGRHLPDFPGLDEGITIEGHLKVARVSYFSF